MVFVIVVLAVLFGSGGRVVAQQHRNNNLRGITTIIDNDDVGSEFNFPTRTLMNVVKLRTKPNTPYRVFTSNTAKNRAKQSRHYVSDDVHDADDTHNNSTPPLKQNTLSTISLAPASAAPITKSPTTEQPTYWPTYSPSTVDPTNAPSSHPTDEPTISPTTDAPSQSPTSSPLAISPDAFDNNLSKDKSQNDILSCSPTQTLMRLEIQTDNYPTDTKWKLIDHTSKVILLSSPRRGYKGKVLDKGGRMEAQTDIREICLGNSDDQQLSIQPRRGNPSLLTQHDNDRVIKTIKKKKNRYEFVLYDKYGDGLCCRPDSVQGFYKVMMQRKKKEDIIIGDKEEDKWQVLVAGSNFETNEVHHHFELEMKSTTLPILEQTSLIDDEDKEDRDVNLASTSTSSAALELLCPSPQRKITIQVQTDKYGEDIAWTFKSKETGMILAKNERNYTNNQVHIDQRDVCIDDSSLYEFTVTDIYADGLKTAQFNDEIPQGHYKIWTHHGMSNDVEIDREVILHGGYFRSYAITHLINTTLPTLSDRDEVWLYEHNKRRKYWHAHYNTSYIPLQWSESLKEEAQLWADHLLDYCMPGIEDGIYHDPDRIYGENAAANEGGGGWGTRREPEKILTRFVEYEVEWPWPFNGHLTQTLWRASKYVGCAEGHRVNSPKHQCHTQVCRYARTGNCNMGTYKREDGSMDYVTAMLEEDNYCGPICPSGGCHA